MQLMRRMSAGADTDDRSHTERGNEETILILMLAQPHFSLVFRFKKP